MWPQGHIRVTFVSQGGLHQWTVCYGALWRGPQVGSVPGAGKGDSWRGQGTWLLLGHLLLWWEGGEWNVPQLWCLTLRARILSDGACRGPCRVGTGSLRGAQGPQSPAFLEGAFLARITWDRILQLNKGWGLSLGQKEGSGGSAMHLFLEATFGGPMTCKGKQSPPGPGHGWELWVHSCVGWEGPLELSKVPAVGREQGKMRLQGWVKARAR